MNTLKRAARRLPVVIEHNTTALETRFWLDWYATGGEFQELIEHTYSGQRLYPAWRYMRIVRGTPYVPSWRFDPPGPRMCVCGHHEGYHGDDGHCVRQRWAPRDCKCAGFTDTSERP